MPINKQLLKSSEVKYFFLLLRVYMCYYEHSLFEKKDVSARQKNRRLLSV